MQWVFDFGQVRLADIDHSANGSYPVQSNFGFEMRRYTIAVPINW